MNVMLQRHCARYIYVVPEGLRELMSDISREVLRSQPEELYTFIADYLDALLITRENARVAAKFVESISEIAATIVSLLLRTGMTREEADRVCTIIQNAFRKYLSLKAYIQQAEPVEEANVVSEIMDEAKISPQHAEAAAVIIQTAYRNFKARQERQRELLTGMIDWRVAARSAIQLYRRTGVTMEEAHAAATKIKAAYKGYYTRRMMRRLVKEAQKMYAREEASEEGGSIMEYLRQLEMQESIEDEYDHKEKSVHIDYDTGIPHVDLSGSQVMQEGGSSQFVAREIMQNILSEVVPSEEDVTSTEMATTDEGTKDESEVPPSEATETATTEPTTEGAEGDEGAPPAEAEGAPAAEAEAAPPAEGGEVLPDIPEEAGGEAPPPEPAAEQTEAAEETE